MLVRTFLNLLGLLFLFLPSYSQGSLPCCAPWMKAGPEDSNELPIQSHSCSFLFLCQHKKHCRDRWALFQLLLFILDLKMKYFWLGWYQKVVSECLVKTCIPCFMLSWNAVEDKWFLQCPGLSCTWFCHVDCMVLFLKQMHNELCLAVCVWC